MDFAGTADLELHSYPKVRWFHVFENHSDVFVADGGIMTIMLCVNNSKPIIINHIGIFISDQVRPMHYKKLWKRIAIAKAEGVPDYIFSETSTEHQRAVPELEDRRVMIHQELERLEESFPTVSALCSS